MSFPLSYPSPDSFILPDSTPPHEFPSQHDPLTWFSAPDPPSPYLYDSYDHDFLVSTPSFHDESCSLPIQSQAPDYYTFDETSESSYSPLLSHNSLFY